MAATHNKKRKSKRNGGPLPLSRWRLRVVLALLMLLPVALIGRLASLQILDYNGAQGFLQGQDFLQGQGDARSLRHEVIPAHRGMITDRNGLPLAVSTPVVSIIADPALLQLDGKQLRRLAALLDAPVKTIEKRLAAAGNSRFMYLRRRMQPEAAAKITALRIKGISTQREYQRYYPAGEVAAHVVGFTNIDDAGQEGMELAYDKWLAAKTGVKRVLKDRNRQIVRELSAGKPPQPGRDLQLSIDLRLQYMAYRELKAALARNKARAGSLVMLDAQSGEVLAMVNQPSYNPNNRAKLGSSALRNRAVTDMFEPGSTVKPFTVAAALEQGVVKPDTIIDTSPGHFRVGRKTLVDPVNYGELTVSKIITKSSQVGTSKLALKMDANTIRDVFQRVGFGLDTGTGFPGESGGLLPAREQWRPIEHVNLAFGYGITVTNLQLAQAYTMIANGGLRHEVSLLKRDPEKADKSVRVLDERVAGKVSDMLKTVTRAGGTGTRAFVPGYGAAGKTGTVHKVTASGYSDDRYIALFAGFVPENAPRLVMVVAIDEPNPNHYYGGEAAAPVFRRVAADALRILNVAPQKALATSDGAVLSHPAKTAITVPLQQVGGAT